MQHKNNKHDVIPYWRRILHELYGKMYEDPQRSSLIPTNKSSGTAELPKVDADVSRRHQPHNTSVFVACSGVRHGGSQAVRSRLTVDGHTTISAIVLRPARDKRPDFFRLCSDLKLPRHEF